MHPKYQRVFQDLSKYDLKSLASDWVSGLPLFSFFRFNRRDIFTVNTVVQKLIPHSFKASFPIVSYSIFLNKLSLKTCASWTFRKSLWSLSSKVSVYMFFRTIKCPIRKTRVEVRRNHNCTFSMTKLND
jgi:hypothetical protein